MKLSSKKKGELRRIAKRYARTSGKEWIEELGDLYRNEVNRRRK